MLSFGEKIVFSIIILLTAFAFLYPLYIRFKIIASGKEEKRFDNWGKRIGEALTKVFLQRCTLKNERVFAGLVHIFIFYGALSFDTMTVNHTLEGFFENFYLFGETDLGLFFSFLIDIFAILVLFSVIFFIIKRFIFKPKAYATTPLDSGIIYFFLTAATLSYLYFEAFAIVHNPHHSRLAFLGGFLAEIVKNSGISAHSVAVHFKISWWLHILVVFAFIAYVPHSKYLHMICGPFNILFRSPQSCREIRPLDIEKTEVWGVEKASDFTWKDFLDAFSCMECGRCQDVCPAFSSEKPLSPKMIVFNLEKHLLKEKSRLIEKKREELPALMPPVFSEGEIWSCTTCAACMHVCPVEIEHIPKIVGLRQARVLMESKFPAELNPFFRNVETNNNPWGIGFSKRVDWAEGQGITTLQEKPGAECLLWVGCAGSFDEEGKKIAIALASILKKAGIDFAILGTEEKCCGDFSRRLGNEYLFQTLAKENGEIFLKYGIRRIITLCPHCYNSFKNEYPAYLATLPFSVEEKEKIKKTEVIHYVPLLARFVKEGRLKLREIPNLSLTYHDSCYLGRHNGIIEEPRVLLSQISKPRLRELKNRGEHSFCCGAGGGMMWIEERLGKRINQMRAMEIIESGAETVITSCPFCLTMLQDGLKGKDREDIKVEDLAQLVAESLEN